MVIIHFLIFVRLIQLYEIQFSGNLIYEMLTGMSPFSNYSQNREVLFYSIINKEIDIPE